MCGGPFAPFGSRVNLLRGNLLEETELPFFDKYIAQKATLSKDEDYLLIHLPEGDAYLFLDKVNFCLLKDEDTSEKGCIIIRIGQDGLIFDMWVKE